MGNRQGGMIGVMWVMGFWNGMRRWPTEFLGLSACFYTWPLVVPGVPTLLAFVSMIDPRIPPETKALIRYRIHSRGRHLSTGDGFFPEKHRHLLPGSMGIPGSNSWRYVSTICLAI